MTGLRLSLFALIFFSVFNFTSPLMGSTYTIGDLGGSPDILSYTVAFFGLGNACTFPMARILGDRFGKARSLYLFGALFILSLVCCSWAPTFFLFCAARFVSGLFSGVFFPLSVALLEKTQTQTQEKRFMANLAFLVSVTPVLGAAFGGCVGYVYEWPWIFHLQIPFVFLSLYGLHRHLPKLTEPLKQTCYDITGYISYIVCISSWVSFTALGQELDWLRSPFLTWVLILACLSTIFFLIWEWHHKSPVIDIRLFRIPTFTVSTVSVILLFSAYFGMVILLSVWLQFDVNYTPIWIALLLVHMCIAGALLFFFVLKWMKKTPPLLPVICAAVAFTLSCFYSSCFNAEINFGRIVFSRVLAGFGLAFFFFPLFILCLRSLPPDKKAAGVAIFQSCRLISGSLGVSLYHTLFIRRTVFYHDRLGSSLTAMQENTRAFFNTPLLLHMSEKQKIELLEKALRTQSSALGLADCFYAMGWSLLGLCIFLIFFSLIQAKKQTPSPSPQE